MKELELGMRALVAQKTGEDWTGATLVLSTAAPETWADLPDLPALRIGRRQPPTPKKGFREAPVGVDSLFADYDRSFVAKSPKDRGGRPVAKSAHPAMYAMAERRLKEVKKLMADSLGKLSEKKKKDYQERLKGLEKRQQALEKDLGRDPQMKDPENKAELFNLVIEATELYRRIIQE